MRNSISVLLVLVSFWAPAAWPKDEPDDSRPPLFLAPGFQFNQVDTMCIAPVADLRADTNDSKLITGAKPPRPPALARAFGVVTFSSVDADLSAIAKRLGHSTTICKPPGGNADDLKLPLADSWASNLNFGESRWLLFVGVEQTSTKFVSFSRSINPLAKRNESGWAVVSAYLFDKQAQPKLVWHDREVGRDMGIMELSGKKEGQKAYEAEVAIRSAEYSLLLPFYRQVGTKKGNPKPLITNSRLRKGLYRMEAFNVSCDVLWTAISHTLNNNPKQYDIVGTYDYTKMAVFAVGGGEESDKRVDYLTLQSSGTGCTEHFVEGFLGLNDRTRLSTSHHDIEHLNKLVYASLP